MTTSCNAIGSLDDGADRDRRKCPGQLDRPQADDHGGAGNQGPPEHPDHGNAGKQLGSAGIVQHAVDHPNQHRGGRGAHEAEPPDEHDSQDEARRDVDGDDYLIWQQQFAGEDDLSVESTSTAAPMGSGDSSRRCGLVGLELLIVLAAIRLRRRFR